MLEVREGPGARITDVFPGGPAAMAGLRVDDIIVAINGEEREAVKHVVGSIERLKPAMKAVMTVLRNGQTLKLSVNVGALKDFHANYIRELMRRDPRDIHFADFHGISPQDMQIEVQRRLFEQNQRMESLLVDVLDEVQALRAEVHKLQQ